MALKHSENLKRDTDERVEGGRKKLGNAWAQKCSLEIFSPTPVPPPTVLSSLFLKNCERFHLFSLLGVAGFPPTWSSG